MPERRLNGAGGAGRSEGENMCFEELLEQTRRMYSETSFPVALIDAAFDTRWANSEAIRCFPVLSFPNGLRSFLAEQDAQQLMEKLREGKPVRMDPITLSTINLIPLVEEGALIGCQAFFGLSDPKTQWEDTERQEKLIGNFSNEYKMPLTIIFSALGLISRTVEGQDPQMRSYLKMITQNCYRLYRLSNNISEAARFSSGIGEMKCCNGDLMLFTRGICEAARILTVSAGIPLEYQFLGERLVTVFDPARLSTVFFNLISNSCKYTREGNRIRIKVETVGCNAVVTVTDSGLGIAEDVLKNIFKPYYTYDPDGHPHGGSGLGLWLVQNIVSMHGGTVAVESRVNEGTKVAFTLPIRVDRSLPDYTAENGLDYLSDRFSPLYIELSDVCGAPMP